MDERTPASSGLKEGQEYIGTAEPPFLPEEDIYAETILKTAASPLFEYPILEHLPFGTDAVVLQTTYE
jgi:hypothetical protein